MTTAETWTTAADLAAARERFEAAIPGWRTPAAFGMGTVASGTAEFPVANAGGAALSAVVLATACGHRAGTASYELTTGQVARAVELLAPAEAYTAVPHPNMAAWRDILEQLRADGRANGGSDGRAIRAVAVFVADLADPAADAYDAALRAAISADGRRP
ncbi:hypothetical protein [Yinghuangia sp. YIM S09857]|uniref:hypothetical protein n=1 Tax=Yinghuangia sp. YIM S09857 TaxID=3436929 RepID=UPI003F52AD26